MAPFIMLGLGAAALFRLTRMAEEEKPKTVVAGKGARPTPRAAPRVSTPAARAPMAMKRGPMASKRPASRPSAKQEAPSQDSYVSPDFEEVETEEEE